MTRRTVTFVVILGALAAWLAAAATSGVQPARPTIATAPAPIDVRGEALAAEIERLHDRLRPTVAPEHGRNLFQFAEPRRADRAPFAAPQAPPPPPAAPAPPPFTLIGIAEDGGVRTGILSTSNGVLLVKVGDPVATNYRVAAISADAIELTDASDGHAVRITLK